MKFILVLIAIALLRIIYLTITQTIRGFRLKRARRIFEKGPQSLEEYMFLFPGACWWCGSREFKVIGWETKGTTSDDPETKVYKGQYTKCNHPGCGFWNGPGCMINLEGGRKDKIIKIYRVDSPYLTEKEAASIPECKYPDTTDYIKYLMGDAIYS